MSYKCLDKERDASGAIKRILLKNLATGKQGWIDKDKLKSMMNTHQISVINLRVDSGGKLIDVESPTGSQENRQPQTQPRLDNEVILNYLKTLEASSKEQDGKIIRILRELYIRQNELCNKIDGLAIKDDDTTSLDEGLKNIAAFLVDNKDKLDEIVSKIESIGQSLMNPPTKDKDDKPSIIESSADGFDLPSNPYEKACYESFFNSGKNNILAATTSEELNRALNAATQNYFENNSVDIEVINKLKSELGPAYKAYKDTKEYYESQLNDFLENFNDCTMLSLLCSTATDKINEVPGLIGETATGKKGALKGVKFSKFKGAIEDCMYTVGQNMVGLYGISEQKRIENNFASSKKLSKAEINAIKTSTNGLWNCVYNFLSGDPQWEIKLYTIQYLNMLYLGRYDASNKQYRTYDAERGNLKSDLDYSLTNKYCNKLSEVYLTDLCEYMAGKSIRSKNFEAFSDAYERVIAAYFAAKKVMYTYGIYPFDRASKPEENGAFINLAIIGSMLLNVKIETAKGMLNITDIPKQIVKGETRMGYPDRYKVVDTPFNQVLGGMT